MVRECPGIGKITVSTLLLSGPHRVLVDRCSVRKILRTAKRRRPRPAAERHVFAIIVGAVESFATKLVYPTFFASDTMTTVEE